MIPVLSRALSRELVAERHRQAGERRRPRPVKPGDRVDARPAPAVPAFRRAQEDAS
jgi:hypothetical protein